MPIARSATGAALQTAAAAHEPRTPFRSSTTASNFSDASPNTCGRGARNAGRGAACALETALEDDDRAQHLAALHLLERVLDLFDADRLGDEAVEVELAAQVEVDQHREVPRR